MRTVRRDVDRLRQLGYAVESEPGLAGGYRLGVGGSVVPPLMLDTEEAFALDLIPNMVCSPCPDGSILGSIAYAEINSMNRSIQPCKPSSFQRRKENIEAGSKARLLK